VDLNFTPRTIMPICLPPPDLKDHDRSDASAVGMGITRDRSACKTNGDGPEMFQRCAYSWTTTKDMAMLQNGKADRLKNRKIAENEGKYDCEYDDATPSVNDPLCNSFHNKLKTLQENKDNNVPMTSEQQRLLDEYEISKEYLLLPLTNLKNELRRKNKTHCFGRDPGEYGWCATCDPNAKENTQGYCSGTKEKEAAVPMPNKGWGYCVSDCRDNVFSDLLKMVKLEVFSEKECRRLGVVKSLSMNPKAELCAAHVTYVNLTLINVTKKGSEDNFALYNLKDKSQISNQGFSSKRLENANEKLKIKTNKIIGGSDTCGGDSGGGLWIRTSTKKLIDVDVLIGVVSRGNGCASANQPGIYGRVKKVEKWIRKYADKPKKYKMKEIYGVQQRQHTIGKRLLVTPYCNRNSIDPIQKIPSGTGRERKKQKKRKTKGEGSKSEKKKTSGEGSKSEKKKNGGKGSKKKKKKSRGEGSKSEKKGNKRKRNKRKKKKTSGEGRENINQRPGGRGSQFQSRIPRSYLYYPWFQWFQ